MRWVRSGIGALGGDASHVTLAGESAGGRGDVHARRRQGPHRRGPGQPGPEDRGPGRADRRPAGRRRPGRPKRTTSRGTSRWTASSTPMAMQMLIDLWRRPGALGPVRRHGPSCPGRAGHAVGGILADFGA
ncbi:hypothetical protein [Kitasatospora sp. NPDC058190]|uniref:hypothetical protein n=1 Tax=Kitasatospora sp. NPDC058190 TaxID=3346371 RepID=UPI0036DF2A03